MSYFVISYSSIELVYILETLLSSHFLSGSQSLLACSRSGRSTVRHFSAELCHNLASVSVQVYIKLSSMFLDIPERFHYSFVLKQLIGIMRSVKIALWFLLLYFSLLIV